MLVHIKLFLVYFYLMMFPLSPGVSGAKTGDYGSKKRRREMFVSRSNGFRQTVWSLKDSE